jgi:hypothetical protein
MEFAVAAAVLIAAVLIGVGTTRDSRTRRDYRERFKRDVGADDSKDLSADQQRSAKNDVRHGRAVRDPVAAEILLRQFDAMGGQPPDFTRMTSLASIGGTSLICVVAVIAGWNVVAFGAMAFLLFFLAVAAWKRRLRRTIERSMDATRLLHQAG